MKGRTGRLAVSMALAGVLAYSPASADRAPIVKLRGVGTSDTGLVRFFKFKIDPIHDGCSITDEGCNPRIRDFRCVSKRGDEPCPWDHGIPRQLSRLDPAETVLAPDGWLLDFNVPFDDGSYCRFSGLVSIKRPELGIYPYTGSYECLDPADIVVESGTFYFDPRFKFRHR